MAIFTHVVLGTNDLERSRKFYDAALAPLGVKRVMNIDSVSLWGTDGPEFMVTKPANGQPATHANGGTCEGPPRSFTPTAYAAYVRDPDGNRLRAYTFVPR